MNSKEKSLIQEQLVKLYLRLNGYFSSGFIIHSSNNSGINTEIDLIAVRFPKNSEPEREIVQDDILFTSNKNIDFLICEVKSHGQLPRFNEKLKDNINNVKSILRWFGIFSEAEIEKYSSDVQKILQNRKIGAKKPDEVIIEEKMVQIRALIFKPETQNRRENQPWFINQKDIFKYIFMCMKPERQRVTSATMYDYTAWGMEFIDLVSFFKTYNYDENLKMSDLYNHIKENN